MTIYLEYLIPVVCCGSVFTCLTGFFCYRDRERIIESCKHSCSTCYCIRCYQNNNLVSISPISPIGDIQNNNTGE